MAHLATPKSCLFWPISKQHFESWDLALQPIVWQKTSASIQTRRCFQSSEGHNVGIVFHSLQSRSNDWHTIEGLWGPWHVMGFPISFGQFATHSILTPFFLWSSFLQCPKGEDVWCTFAMNQYENVRTWHLCLGAQWHCLEMKYPHQASISHSVVGSERRVLPPWYCLY